jgi:hypothetical protein
VYFAATLHYFSSVVVKDKLSQNRIQSSKLWTNTQFGKKQMQGASKWSFNPPREQLDDLQEAGSTIFCEVPAPFVSPAAKKVERSCPGP